MKFNALVLLLTLLITTLSFSQTTYFIKYKENVSIAEVDRKVVEQTFSDVVNFRQSPFHDFDVNYLAKGLGRGDDILGRIVKIHFTENVSETELTSLISADPDIEYIQKANTYQANFIPNDSLLAQQWALDKIRAFDAWDITAGSDTVLLAIIDTGIEYFHPDLQNKIFINSGEMGLDQFGNDKRFNGIDDDGNGFIDDYMGWDFVDRVGFPFDTTAGDYLTWDNMPYDTIKGANGNHGTLVAGIAGAEANNISGIAGTAPNVRLLNIRSFDNSGSGEEDDAAAALLYAVKMGAKVINMSWGDYSFSYVLRDVIRYAYSQNVVLVASAGNRNVNTPHYPSGYSEVISVSGSTSEDFIAGFSWGSTIDLVAPAISILSTDVNLSYNTFSGTSSAAPFVSATAALILSLGTFTNEEVKQIIKSTTDDIGEPGWDIRTGSGRLNLSKALKVLAPSDIRFHFPLMDYATNEDNIPIIATVLSSYFISYKLDFGIGIEPNSWNILIDNGLNQFIESEIYNLDVSDLSEGIYTLRLSVRLNNGQVIQERIYFHVMRTAPRVIEVGMGSLYYGDRSVIAAEFYTNQLAVMRLYYRVIGESIFNFISLDGFNTNNQFVKQFHYGFLPKEIVNPNTLYEVYFEAENLAGFKTVVMDSSNGIDYFKIKTDKLPEPIQFELMPYALENSITLFSEPVSFLSNNKNEVLVQPFITGSEPIFYNYVLENDSFVRFQSDSLLNRFPQLYGDFNNNGLKNLMTLNFSNVVSLEQTQQGSFTFSKKDSTTRTFYPLLIDELIDDGNKYLITQNFSPDRYLLWKINQDLTTTLIDSTFYVAVQDTFGNNRTSKNIFVVDADNDSNKEIWILDEDGDLKSLKVNPNLTFTKSDSFYIQGLTPPLEQNILSIGDYNGDGIKDFAILYETNSIAPTFLLLIITFENHVPKVLSQKVFLDQSAEYVGGLTFTKIYQSLNFVDIDSDGLDELVVNIFPYTYIFKYSAQESKMVFYAEGGSTRNTFVGDLNQNGVVEIGLKINEVFRFYEFSNSIRTLIPALFEGHSVSFEEIMLSWNSDAQKFFIYKGTNASNIELIDSTFEKSYLDNNVELNTEYFYSIQAYDAAKPEPLSALSKVIQVYSHKPAEAVAIVNNSSSSVIVTFSDKMKSTIENLQSFEIIGMGFPNSVSPSDQFSYLLSFSQPLPDGENKLFISKIRDFYNSPVPEDTISFIVTHSPDLIEFYVSSFEIMNPYMIKVVFNFPVDEQSALNTNNYSFEPDNKVSNVIIDENDNKIVYLDLRNQKPVGSIGKEYVLRIENVLSDASMGNILIKSGAGSYIVLTGFAPDLSDVYVYPNPVKAGESQNAVTFANLPRRAKITIWDINGVKINEIEERDGNGGVDYNLTNQFGERISTGIYIYRVVMIDDQNSEGEEKLGKFAVIK
ncbi:MAG: S8 family peptidase [Ignavibacteriaceae bacterium]